MSSDIYIYIYIYIYMYGYVCETGHDNIGHGIGVTNEEGKTVPYCEMP